MTNRELVILGAVGLGAYWLIRQIPKPPSVTEAAHTGFWYSSFGQLADKAAGLYNGWGQFDPLSDAEAAEVQAVVDQINKETGYSNGGWGSL
ncbi:hypothetical protein [Vreelandella sulfidaeris]|uniref:hypothetical protein n=1 Tax=Vreelandella sulfidaeris TaxID=115553 RepID=UPI0035E4B84C